MVPGMFRVLGVGAVFFAVLPVSAAKPTTANARFTQTAYTPLPIGSCSGMDPGCSGVYGIDWLSDGRMVLLTSDVIYQGNMAYPGRPLSKVTLVSGLATGGTVTTQDIATGFKLPTGVVVVNDRIYVADMDSFYVIPTNNPAPGAANLAANRQRRFQMPHPLTTGANPLGFQFPASMSGPSGDLGEPAGGWTQQNSFWHQYMYSPYFYQGKIYAGYSGATAAAGGFPTLNPVSYFGGAVLAFDTSTTGLDTTVNRAAGGLRSPGGIGRGNGFSLIADNQGGYRPMCELFPVKPFTQQYFGYRQAPTYIANWAQAAYERGQMHYTPSVAVMEFGAGGWRSVTQPLYLSSGPYAGDWLVGDAYSTGIARVAFDSLPDTTGAPNAQAAVFWFVGGATGAGVGTGNNAIHRLSLGPDGAIYAGVLRSIGNWPQGASTQLLYKYAPNANAHPFEILKIRSLADGFELILSEKVNPSAVTPANFTVQQRNWVRQSTYGGGMGTNSARTVSSVGVSSDSLRIHLVVPGIRRLNQDMRADTITHWITKFAISNLTSAAGLANYTSEATYAQNWVSPRAWNAAEATPVASRNSAALPLSERVWFTQGPGWLRVHADLGKRPYQAALRDLRGRLLSRQTASAGQPLEFTAPPGSQAVYTIEVRADSRVYAKSILF